MGQVASGGGCGRVDEAVGAELVKARYDGLCTSRRWRRFAGERRELDCWRECLGSNFVLTMCSTRIGTCTQAQVLNSLSCYCTRCPPGLTCGVLLFRTHAKDCRESGWLRLAVGHCWHFLT